MTTKTVTLPSGQTVKIKKPGVLGWHRVTGYLPRSVDPAEAAPVASAADNVRATIALVCACSVEPKFSDADTPPAGSISIDDLDLDDFNALVAAVTELASLAKGNAEVSPLSATGTPS